MSGSVKTTIQDGISVITFAHPAHNSLPANLLASLTAAIQAAGKDPNTTLVLLQSAGEKTFCAGASFDELAAIRTQEQGKQFFLGFANVINAIRTCPKFVIARVQGRAIGGGVGIAAAVQPELMKPYDGLRTRLGGVGAARLDGSRCLGCHIQIPEGEMIALRALPTDELVFCPECGRILVR